MCGAAGGGCVLVAGVGCHVVVVMVVVCGVLVAGVGCRVLVVMVVVCGGCGGGVCGLSCAGGGGGDTCVLAAGGGVGGLFGGAGDGLRLRFAGCWCLLLVVAAGGAVGAAAVGGVFGGGGGAEGRLLRFAGCFASHRTILEVVGHLSSWHCYVTPCPRAGLHHRTRFSLCCLPLAGRHVH